MKTNLSDLIAALPHEEDVPEILGTAEAQERLQAIFADLAQRPVPTGSLHRLWTLGELSTQVTLAYAALWFRQLFADAQTKERRAMETNLRVALKIDAVQELVRKGYTSGHPMNIYLHRACFGLGALLLRLRCRVDVREIRRLELERRAAGGES